MNDQQHAKELMLEQHKLAETILDKMQAIAPWQENPLKNNQLEEMLIGINIIQERVDNLKTKANNFIKVRDFVADMYWSSIGEDLTKGINLSNNCLDYSQIKTPIPGEGINALNKPPLW